MYIPPHFAESRPDELARIIRTHPLGMLVTYGDHRLDANHIPFEFDADSGPLGRLTSHVARANDLWSRFPTGSEVMVVFRGSEGYISPSWYPSKHESHRQVPTWNYEVVHAHGLMTIRDDERFVRANVAHLTRIHEAKESRPWMMRDAPPDFVDMLIRNIVGIEIAVTSIVGKVKLSQNKDTRDRSGAADALQLRNRIELADRMRPR